MANTQIQFYIKADKMRKLLNEQQNLICVFPALFSVPEFQVLKDKANISAKLPQVLACLDSVLNGMRYLWDTQYKFCKNFINLLAYMFVQG